MSRYVKTFEGFIKKNFLYENLNRISKVYKNVNDIIDFEKIEIYQIPFTLGDGDGTCIYNADSDWNCCIGKYYVYDFIKDNEITDVLQKDLSHIDISKGWEYQQSDEFETAYTNKEKHIFRIAKLVQEMKKGEKINPIQMCFDSLSYHYDMVNHIQDGNHRIRALQYLNYDCFPAIVYGSHTKDLIKFIEENYEIS